MLEELKESRDQEIAPYVIVYFDLPYANPYIHLVAKNLGKSVAKNVKIKFQPEIKNSLDKEKFSNIPLIKNGISSLCPGQEIRTFFDDINGYFDYEDSNGKLPTEYTVTVTYTGGLKTETRKMYYTLDLSSHKTYYITKSKKPKKGIHELVNTVENISKQIENITNKLGK